MSRARTVAGGAGALALSNLIVMVFQLGYAAFTSRLLDPSAFGIYAVALSGIGLIGLVSGAGFGQAAARAARDDVDGHLAAAALVIGLLSATLACALAVPLAVVWGSPNAWPSMMVLAISIPATSLAAVPAGTLRRSGKTAYLATIMGSCQAIGMFVGLLVVLAYRAPIALTVSPVVASLFALTWLALAARMHVVLRGFHVRGRDDVLYGLKANGMNFLRYLTGTASALTISRYVGAASLGSYNRAQAVIIAPLESLQRSASAAVFPELRAGGSAFRSSHTFTDIVVLMTWVAALLTPLAVCAASPILGLILGPGWEEAQTLAPWAAAAGLLPFVAVPLSAVVEARGRYRVPLLSWAIGACFAVAAVAAILRFDSPLPAVMAVVASTLAAIAIYSVDTARRGGLWASRYGHALREMAAVETPAIILLVALAVLAPSPLMRILGSAIVGLSQLAAIWAVRGRLTFFKILVAYGLIPSALVAKQVEARGGTAP